MISQTVVMTVTISQPSTTELCHMNKVNALKVFNADIHNTVLLMTSTSWVQF